MRAELPGVLLQWEDFATPHALPILERYREQVLSFNDDIQGTAAVVLAALSAGAAATGSRLRDQSVVMLGAGSAGIGVCEQVVRSMAADGLSATGSPFQPMRVGDASIPVAQCNNIYIFPGVGLAVTAVRATRVTDAMMTAAAAVGDAATIRHDPRGTLLPGRAQLAGTATAVASAVAKAAVADAVAPALTDDQIDQAIDRARWLPGYPSYRHQS